MLRFKTPQTTYQDTLDNIEGEGFYIKEHELIHDDAFVVEIPDYQDERFIKTLDSANKLNNIYQYATVGSEPMKSNFEEAVRFFKDKLNFFN